MTEAEFSAALRQRTKLDFSHITFSAGAGGWWGNHLPGVGMGVGTENFGIRFKSKNLPLERADALERAVAWWRERIEA